MPLTPSRTRSLLESLGHRPRKDLGQNFLVDGNIVQKSLALAAVGRGDHVVDVGPGLGTLTTALLDAGARVHAVEFDPRLAQHLRETLGENERLSLVEADAVERPLGDWTGAAGGDFKIVANLPYAITSPWLEKVLTGPLPSTLVLMLQKEAADRLAATPGGKHFGALAVFLQAAYRVAGTHRVSRPCFYPVPDVDSVLLHLERLPAPRRFPEATRQAIRRLFTQRRKQLGGLVKAEAGLAKWLDAAVAHGVTPHMRAEAVPLAAWRLLASQEVAL